MKREWLKQLFTYPQITGYAAKSFMQQYRQADKVMMAIMMMHWIVAAFVTSQAYGTYLYGFAGGGLILGMLWIASRYFEGTHVFRALMGIAMMLFSLIFIQQHLGRIEMHFHVFIGLAILILYKDIVPIIAASATTIIHHLVFNYLQLYEVSLFGMPVMVFNYGCGMDIVILHAIFVVVEAAVIGYIIKIQREYVLDINRSETEIRGLNEELSFTSLHDPLTGLPNRSNLTIQLQTVMNHARRHRKKFALLFLDLDHFKYINDTLGHDIGDILLTKVSRKLKSAVRGNDIVARIGGDEFIIVLTDGENTYAIEQTIEKLLTLFRHQWNVKEHLLRVSASIGVAVYPDDAKKVDELMKFADIAMYQAKSLGRDQFSFFTSELNQKVHKEVELTNDMHRALKEREFVLHLQPKIDLVNNTIIGAEALIRWQHGTKGMIYPDEFIPIAENNGFIVELGRWVIEESARIASRIQNRGFEGVHISCNVSTKQLRDPKLCEVISNAIDETRLDPKLLSIEITESVMMEERDNAIHILEVIREHGVHICMDDFGTGYSSLSYLQLLPIDALKTDKSFVDKIIRNNERSSVLIDTIIAMGKTLNLSIVAEGIENSYQEAYLKARGCDYGQGYLYSRPVPEAEFMSLLEKGV